MTRLRIGLAALLAVVLALAPATPVLAQGNYYWFQAVTEGDEPFAEEGAVRCSVYGRDATTGTSIVHTTAQLTAAYTLPLASNANGIVHWYSSGTDPVNLKCFTQYGDYAYKNAFTRAAHKVRIDTTGAYKIFRFPYVTNAAPTATGLVIPQGGIVTGLAVERISIGDGAHLNVGFNGNHAVALWDGLVSQLAIDQRGFIMVHTATANAAAPAEVSDVVTSTANHVGLVMRHMLGGAGGATGAANFVKVPYMVHVGSGLELRYNTSNRAGLGGHVYVYWTQTHLGANRQPLR